MSTREAQSNRRVTIAAGIIAAGALLMAGPAATAFADDTPSAPSVPKAKAAAAPPDYSIGGFLNNAGQFVGALGTNTEQFVGTLGNNVNQLVGVGGNNVSNFVGTLGTNTLVFAGTLGNNLVGNPPNAGGKVTPVSTVTTSGRMQGSFQCNSSGSGSCTG
jgi:hypothetical protein